MAFPATPLAIKVWLALGANPATDPYSWTWTEVTNYVYVRDGVTITRGRDDEQTQAGPSSLTLTLDNRDGRFTPSNPVGAYYGSIGKNTPIMVTVDVGSGDTPRFTGFVSEWPPRWDVSGNDAYVSLQADGILRRLSQGDTPGRSDLYRSIMSHATKPKAYWPLEETGGRADTAFSSALPGVSAMVPSVATVGTHKNVGTVSGSVDGAPGSGKAVDTSDGGQLTGTVPQTSTNAWRVDCNVLFTEPVLSTETGQILRVTTYQGLVTATWGVYARSTAGAELRLDLSGVASNNATKSLIIDDGSWHHVSLRVTSNAGNSQYALYIDGVLQLSGTFASEPFGRVKTITVSPSGDCEAVGHVVYWDDWPVADDFAQAAFGHMGESATDRFVRLAASEGVLVSSFGKTQDFELNADGFGGTWQRDNTSSFTGSWSLKSFAITHDATTDAIVTVPRGAKLLNFWYRVSSEQNFDFFQVRVDGVTKLSDSGTTGEWKNATVDVTGASAVVFRYAKDASLSSGSDAAWIDNVTFSHSVPMGPQAAGSFLALLRDCETADIGTIYETLDGYLGFHEHSYRYNGTPTMTLDYDSGHIAPPLEPVDDDRDTANDVTVQTAGNFEVEAINANHIARFGRYTSTVTANVQGEVELIDNATWRLWLGTSERLRYPRVVVNFARNPSLISSWLATDVDDRIALTNLPPGLPPDDIELIVNGYTERLNLYEWTVELNCTPAEPWDVATVDGNARADAVNSTLFADITSTQTTLDATEVWVDTATTPSAFPFDILVGGERMTVTSSLFLPTPPRGRHTVVRSVNGVVKAHLAGTPVHVAEPAVVAL